MIELIKQPKYRTDRIQFACQNCRAEWIADAADYERKIVDQWVGNKRQFSLQGRCPCCGEKYYYGIYKENKCWKYVDSNETTFLLND